MKILLINSVSHRLVNSKNHMKNQIPVVMSKWNKWFWVFAYFVYTTALLLILNLNLFISNWIILAVTLIRVSGFLWYLIIFEKWFLSFEGYILGICFYKLLEFCIQGKFKMIKNIFCGFKTIKWLIILLFLKGFIYYFARWICWSCYLFFLNHIIKLWFYLISITRVFNNILEKLF